MLEKTLHVFYVEESLKLRSHTEGSHECSNMYADIRNKVVALI